MIGKKTRTTAAVLATTAVLALAACSEGAAPATTKLDPSAVPDAKTTLTVWSFLPDNYEGGDKAYGEVVAAFEKKYPQVTVDLKTMPYGKYFDQVRNATVARKGADVITMYGGAQAYSYRNGLYPLQDAMLPEVEKDLKFVPENYSQDGNLYILPTGSYGYGVLVNQDLFASAGVDPQAALGSWDGLLDACRTFQDKGIQPFGAGWKDGYLFETIMYMMSSELMDSDTLDQWVAGEIPVDDPMFVKATGYILDMNKAGCFGGAETLGLNLYDDGFNQYYAGKSAMVIQGSLEGAQRGAEAVPSTTVMRFPQVPGSKHESIMDAGASAGWSVTKWTKSPEAAAAFVNFMAGSEAQGMLWDSVGIPPNIAGLDIQGETEIQKTFLPLMLADGNHTGFASFPLNVLAVYERNAAPLISGAMSVEEFTEQAQSAFEKSQ